MTEQSPARHPLDQLAPVVEKAQRGDIAALEVVLDAVYPYVAAICGRIAGPHQEDATQEALIAIFRALHGLKDPQALRAWISRIAVREAVKTSRRERPLDVFPLDTATLEAPEGVDDADVRSVVATMSLDHRVMLTMRSMGFAEAEIAAALDVPKGTVKSRLHRAREEFRKRWNR